MLYPNRPSQLLAVFTLLTIAATPVQADKVLELAQFSPSVIYDSGRAADRQLTVEAFEQRFVIHLSPNISLWPGHTPELSGESPGTARYAFYRGKLEGVPASWARINRIGDEISGMFSDGTDLYMIDQAAAFALPPGRTVEPDAIIVFRLRDLRADWIFDHRGVIADDPAQPAAAAPADSAVHQSPGRLMVRDADDMIPVTIVSDTDFSDNHGGDTAAVVQARMNLVDGYYSNQAGTGMLLWHHEILGDNGPLTATDPGELLGTFRDFMATGDGSGIPFAGQAHLFTGRNIDNAAGIAFVNVTCNTTSGVGVNEDLGADTISALIVAHELGHNFSAGHDDDPESCPVGTPPGIMNSTISTSNDEFSQCSLNAIVPEFQNASCLQSNPEILFRDRFD